MDHMGYDKISTHHGVVVEERVAVDLGRDECDGHAARRRDVAQALHQL